MTLSLSSSWTGAKFLHQRCSVLATTLSLRSLVQPFAFVKNTTSVAGTARLLISLFQLLHYLLKPRLIV
jgi:hypothetical protein